MKCGNCKLEIPDGSQYCLHCGKKVETVVNRKCCFCGFEKLPAEAIYCPNCGKNIKEAEERAQKEKLEAIEKEEEEKRKKQEEERQKQEEEERRKQEEERLKREEEERKIREEEERKKKEEERKRQEEEERRKREEEERRRKEAERQKKVTELISESRSLKAIISLQEQALAKVEKEYKEYERISSSISEEERLLSQWKASSLNQKYSIVHKNYHWKYDWLQYIFKHLNDSFIEGWENNPDNIKEYMKDILYGITFPIRSVVFGVAYSVVTLFIGPLFLLGSPFYTLYYLFGWIVFVNDYKEEHTYLLNTLKKEVEKYDKDALLHRLSSCKEDISQKEERLSLIEAQIKAL
jgi:chemotaxis protein histidine kinase CheA